MKNRRIRHQKIREIISTSSVGSQEDLLQVLNEKGFSLTQATLSRDLKSMKVLKQATETGEYKYILPIEIDSIPKRTTELVDTVFAEKGFVSIEFSGNMAVIKTKPGYAAGIASDIDTSENPEFIGTIAGDDTILLIMREGVSREKVIKVLSSIIPSIKG